MRNRFTPFWLLLIALPLLAADATPIDSFTAGSHWTGTEAGDPRKPNTHQAAARPAKFNVSERNADTFAAEYIVEANALRVEGKVSEKGAIQAVATRIIRGKWDGEIKDIIWSGQVEGSHLQLAYSNSHNLDRTIDLTLAAGEGGGGSRHGKNKN